MNIVEHDRKLTGIAASAPALRRAAPGLFLACALLSARGGQAAATTVAPVGLSVQVTLELSGLHPAVTQAGLDCGAIAQSTAWVGVHRAALVDYDSANQFVLRPAHYLSQESMVSFPVVGRRYSGSTTMHLALAPQGLIDPVTHRPWAPAPVVLVACWLMLNGQPAAWDKGPGAQPVRSANFSGVSPNPLVIAIADATGGGPLAVTGRLSVHGQYFVPAPVSVAATIQLSGAATAPIANVPNSLTAAANSARPPVTPAVSGPSSNGSTRVPAPTTLSGALTATRSTRLPLALTLTGALSAATGTRLPRPLILTGTLSATGGARLPMPITVNAALMAKGGAHLPAPITLSAALTSAGAVNPAALRRTQSPPPPPK